MPSYVPSFTPNICALGAEIAQREVSERFLGMADGRVEPCAGPSVENHANS